MRVLALLASTTLVLVSPARSEVDAERPAGEWIVVRANEPAARADAGHAPRYGPTREDFQRILGLPGVRAAVPLREVVREVRYGEAAIDALIVGTTSDAALSRSLRPTRGRFLTSRDESRLNNVAVLGSVVARRLFPHVDALGRNVRIGNEYFLVVGVLAEVDGQDGMERNQHVYVPHSTMLSRFGELDVRRNAGAFEIRRFEMNGIDLLVDPTRRPHVVAALREVLETGATAPGEYEIDVRPRSHP